MHLRMYTASTIVLCELHIWCCGIVVVRFYYCSTYYPFPSLPLPYVYNYMYSFLHTWPFSSPSLLLPSSIPTLLGVSLDSWDPTRPAEATWHILQPRQKQTVHIPVGGRQYIALFPNLFIASSNPSLFLCYIRLSDGKLSRGLGIKL